MGHQLGGTLRSVQSHRISAVFLGLFNTSYLFFTSTRIYHVHDYFDETLLVNYLLHNIKLFLVCIILLCHTWNLHNSRQNWTGGFSCDPVKNLSLPLCWEVNSSLLVYVFFFYFSYFHKNWMICSFCYKCWYTYCSEMIILVIFIIWLSILFMIFKLFLEIFIMLPFWDHCTNFMLFYWFSCFSIVIWK